MSIQKNLKTAIKALIPGMFFRRVHKIEHDLNNGIAQKRRRIFIELGISVLCLMGGAALGGFIGFAILIPALGLVSQGAMVAILLLSVVVAGLILAEVGFLLAKESLRFFSWLKNHNDLNVVNPTNVEKYTARHYQGDKPQGAFEIQQTEAQNAMRKLYVTKQKIKNNPEGNFGELSTEQEETCNVINYAVKELRNKSVTNFFKPVSSISGQKGNDRSQGIFKAVMPELTEEELNIILDKMDEESDQTFFRVNGGVTPSHLKFLKTVIWGSDDDQQVMAKL